MSVIVPVIAVMVATAVAALTGMALLLSGQGCDHFNAGRVPPIAGHFWIWARYASAASPYLYLHSSVLVFSLTRRVGRFIARDVQGVWLESATTYVDTYLLRPSVQAEFFAYLPRSVMRFG